MRALFAQPQAGQRTTASDLCLGGLIKHVTSVERNWAAFIVDGPSTMPDFTAMTEADFVAIDEGFALIRCAAPETVQQRPLDTLAIRRTYGVSIVAVRRPGQGWEATEPGTVLYDNDQILVTGPTAEAEAFSDLI